MIFAFLGISTAVQAQAPLILGAYNKTVTPGQEICMDIYGRQFTDILSMQYTLQWNPDVLEFKEVKGFAISGLSKENFGAHRTKEGLLTFSWYEPYLRGVTIPDGATIYQVCFTVKAKTETNTKLEFVNAPTPVEIVNSSEIFLSLKGEGGTIRVKK